MQSLFNSEASVLAVIALTAAFAIFAKKLPVFKSLGAPLTVIVISIILVNLRVMPAWHDAYGTIMNYAVYMSIAMLLLSVDISAMFKLSRKPLLAMAIACLSVMVVATLAGVIFAPHIEDGWKVAGMFVGTYTGGSSNLTAIAKGLDVTESTLAAANAADYVVGLPAIVLMFAIPSFMKKSKWFKKIWPYSLSDKMLEQGNENDELLVEKTWSIQDISITIGLSLLILLVSNFLSSFITPEYASAVRVLSVTSLAIILAQFKFIKKIKGTMDLGMYFALLYLCIIGYMVDLRQFGGSALTISMFCFVVIIGSFLLHVLICRLLKMEYQYVLISVVAGIADGATSGLVAAGAGWKSIISIAVVLGVIGAAIGNYLGIGVAYLIRMIVGG